MVNQRGDPNNRERPYYRKNSPNLPTNQRLASYRKGTSDYQLEKLYYQFGRYLLIASSRPGNMPANLQGMWHNNLDGPWRVDYHNNINLQMNYWPACSTNLSECAWPLIDFIRSLVKPGEKTAQAYFNAREEFCKILSWILKEKYQEALFLNFEDPRLAGMQSVDFVRNARLFTHEYQPTP